MILKALSESESKEMEFYVKVTKERKRRSIGEIKIGDFIESFDMANDYWTVTDYKRQWTDGLRRVTQGKDSSLEPPYLILNQQPT